ncbi:Serine/threonine-protein kinase PrkC [Stieleria maiorica]|uniref:Serine/threonine-protein kinase PrkC n=1 Tax=Stieleria maiorica TaxID=2795974 RepID=A0A5B9MJB2_9BACT|nr:protein kinase [Stieleria maiorica]QEG01299.1 Serine/threonine-protein kinase PrkC [Stieleria maiorica]
MKFSGYQLLSQRGAGKDCVAYLARELSSGNLVQLCDLTSAAKHQRRWARLTRQLKKIAVFSHPAGRPLIQLQLNTDPRFAVLGLTGTRTLADNLQQPSLQWPTALAICLRLSDCLMHAHRLGISHGNLCPSGIGIDDDDEPIVDFTQFLAMGITSSQTSDPLDRCCLPKSSSTVGADPAANDIYALGAMHSMLLGIGRFGRLCNAPIPPLSEGESASLESLIDSMLDDDPLDRPLADEVVRELNAGLRAHLNQAHLSDPGFGSVTSAPTPSGGAETGGDAETIGLMKPAPAMGNERGLEGRRLGRFQIERRIGSGAWGAVFRAIDVADGATVAVKVLHPEHANCRDVVKRFRDEAHILAGIDNPHVAKLLDVNCQDGVHYLAMEFVDGPNLASLLARHGSIDEPRALQILADVARALVEPHEYGVVHRDIKPANIIIRLAESGGRQRDAVGRQPDRSQTAASDGMGIEAATLVDFGLAQDLFDDRPESDAGEQSAPRAIVGTPAYMSPEQCGGEPVGPETDVYAMGATLFHLLAGRPPFLGDNIQAIIDQHRNQAPPRISEFRAGIPDSVTETIDRALAKRPVLRHADAEALLVDVERLLRGEPVSIESHPFAPGDPSAAMRFQFQWPLRSSPAALWPHVSNTERLNEAIGLPVVDYTRQVDDEGGVTQTASAERLGMKFQWREHPFEWIEGKRLAVLRDFQSGPFKWMISRVELQASSDGGTHLSHHVIVQPRSVLGRAAAALEVGVKAKRALKRVYFHIDRTVAANGVGDPFRQPNRLKLARRRRLDQLIERLRSRELNAHVVARLSDCIEKAPAQELARIRPLAFARQYGLNADAVVDTFLAAAHEGLLVLYWDILCPSCRIPSDIKETLREVKNHSHCPACNLDFELDFAGSVELIFRVSPQIRQADVKTYCIGGPAHSPHVVAQLRIDAAERLRLDLSLDVGSYQLRGLPCALVIDFEVAHPGETSRWDIDVDADSLSTPLDVPLQGPEMKAGRQCLVLANHSRREQVIRVERRSPRTDVLTAARASTLRSFRQWFPGEILSPGELVGVGAMALMTLSISDDPQAGQVANALAGQSFLKMTSEVVERFGGTTLPGPADRVRVAFDDPSRALLAALDLHQSWSADGSIKHRRLKIALDHGGSVAVSVQDQLDYLGETARAVERIFQQTQPGELTMSVRAASDPVVASLLTERQLDGRMETIETDDHGPVLIHRFGIESVRADVDRVSD